MAGAMREALDNYWERVAEFAPLRRAALAPRRHQTRWNPGPTLFSASCFHTFAPARSPDSMQRDVRALWERARREEVPAGSPAQSPEQPGLPAALREAIGPVERQIQALEARIDAFGARLAAGERNAGRNTSRSASALRRHLFGR